MAYKDEAYLNMNCDDERAARVLTLAVKFFGSSLPVAASDIRRELYPTLDQASFFRQYLRDRELLSSMGIVVRQTGENGTETYWKVDGDVSYVQGEGIGPDEARMLYVLCHDMAFDQSFAYRDELRMALVKIAQMYRGATFPHVDGTSAREHKTLAALVGSMSARHGVRVSYTDAHGATSTRDLALLGSFGLWGQTYFVASRVDSHGSLTPDSLRTYRLDRFDKVHELPKVSYEIPQDFSVSDYERLPFQMGDAVGVATLKAGAHPSRTVTRAQGTQGTLLPDGTWEGSYHSITDLASWCVGSDIIPVTPPELVKAWKRVREEAAEAICYDASLAVLEPTPATSTATHQRGRIGSVLIVKQLMALATSLTREGEVITAADISQSLGVSYDQARHLIALVSMGSGESLDYLPVILGERDDEVSLMEGAALKARRIRLTTTEATALMAALSELGVPDDDPLAQALSSSFLPQEFSVDEIARTLEQPSSASDTATLQSCSAAIYAGTGLSFVYRPVYGGAAQRRNVFPLLVRRSDDSWYLDAFDLQRQDYRVFRIDRMSEVSQTEQTRPSLADERKSHQQTVVVRFGDPHYLSLFYWEGLERCGTDGEAVVARVPYFGGTWLARHLAACAGTVQVSDPQLAEQIHAVAQET